jgi:hypothetical protein
MDKAEAARQRERKRKENEKENIKRKNLVKVNLDILQHQSNR